MKDSFKSLMSFIGIFHDFVPLEYPSHVRGFCKSTFFVINDQVYFSELKKMFT